MKKGVDTDQEDGDDDPGLWTRGAADVDDSAGLLLGECVHTAAEQ